MTYSQRLKEMKQLTKDTGGGLSRGKSSQANSEIKSISLTPASNPGAPKKKPVFKTVGAPSTVASAPFSLGSKLDVNDPKSATEENDPSGAVRNGWYAEGYEPEFVTGCDVDCGACGGRDGRIAI